MVPLAFAGIEWAKIKNSKYELHKRKTTKIHKNDKTHRCTRKWLSLHVFVYTIHIIMCILYAWSFYGTKLIKNS